jgi:PPOX class probable F420-dependent enzyme
MGNVEPMPSIADEKYVSLTTYKKDGSTTKNDGASTAVPVWITDFGDGTIGFTTSSSSVKVQRIKNDGRVILQPSDSRGKAREGTEPVTGTATVVEGTAFEPYEAKVKAKYGILYSGVKLLGKFMSLIGKGSGTDAAVLVTLDESSGAADSAD